MNALDPVEVEEAVTSPEAFIVRNSLPCRLSDLTGKTWKIQIKDIYMTDTVSFCLEKKGEAHPFKVFMQTIERSENKAG